MDNEDDWKYWIIGLVAFIILISAVLFLLNGAGLIWERAASPYQEETRSLTYDQSRAYQQGTQRDLARYCRQYAEASGPAKSAIANLIRDTAATYNGPLTPSNETCLSEIGN